MNVASAPRGLFPRPDGAGPHRPTPVWQWPRARASCVPPILPLSPVLLLPVHGKLRLPINCKNARCGCAPCGHSRSWVVRTHCSLYELMAAVASKDRSSYPKRFPGLIAGRLSWGDTRKTNGVDSRVSVRRETATRLFFWLRSQQLCCAAQRLGRLMIARHRHAARPSRDDQPLTISWLGPRPQPSRTLAAGAVALAFYGGP